MKRLCKWSVGLCLAGCLSSPLLAAPLVLETPALQSVRAERSAILGLARAGERLVAVGERGTVLLSDNDGRSWRQAHVPVSVSLTAVQFVDARRGWATGHLGVVLHSEDGGETWIKQLDGIQAARLALAAAESSGDQRQLDEARRLVEDGPDKPFLDLYFSDALRGFVVGAYNLILHTEDGGQSWQPWMGRLENPNGLHLYGIRARGEHLFIAGERGLLLRSIDAGKSFQALASPYEGSFFGLVAGSAGELVAFGLRGNAWISRDDGEHWRVLPSQIQSSFVAGVVLDDGRVLLASQDGELVRASDQGLEALGRLPGNAISSLAESTEGQVLGAGLGGVSPPLAIP